MKKRATIPETDIKGRIYLYKNDKMIREIPFRTRWYRRKFMLEFLDLCKIGTGDSYYITVKLDI